MPAFSVMIKPTGPLCNLACRYCFYVEKKSLYRQTQSYRMSDEVLETFVRQYLSSQEVPEVQFCWQGGEPTLLGIDFFRRAVELQRRYANGKTFSNAFQTNGILLNDEWCRFLSEQGFLVGLSIDGPREVHDRYRRDRQGRGSFDAVMKAVEMLKKHGTRYNTLTVVNDVNVRQPLAVYRFLKEIGDGFMQFVPLVERRPNDVAGALGLNLGLPPRLKQGDQGLRVMPWSVHPGRLGEFYVQIFDEWVRHDVGRHFVQFFDEALGSWLGAETALCQFAPVCGRAVVLEHNGDLYACDHYVYPDYKLGNILAEPLPELLASEGQCRFGRDKLDLLPNQCLDCPVRFACNGDCPKHRFARTADGQPGLSYLCPAYKRIFTHMDPYMRCMARLIVGGRPPANIMAHVLECGREKQFAETRRNTACPCSSGKKLKKCCGSKVKVDAPS